MSVELIITIAVLVILIVLLCLELLPVGQSAMLAVVVLLVTGVVESEQVFAGFTNHATVTVGAMFVISAAVYRTGAVNVIGDILIRLIERGLVIALLAMCLSAGLLSAFVNNTTVVAILLPIVIRCATHTGTSASLLLMPLSFACILGGTCTLIGTSTNLIVSSLARAEGFEPIGMFEMAPVGLVFFAIGLVYLVTAGRWLIPPRRGSESLEDSFSVGEYITQVKLAADSDLVGRGIDEALEHAGVDGDVLGIQRHGRSLSIPHRRTRLRAGDVIRLRGAAADISRLLERPGVAIFTANGDGRGDGDDIDPLRSGIAQVEAVVGPGSPLVNRAIGSISFPERHGAVVLALRRWGEIRQQRFDRVRLRVGDVLLLGVEVDRLPRLTSDGDFLLVSERPVTRFRRDRMLVALLIFAGVVACATLGLASIAVASLIGSVLVLATGCLRLEEAVEAVDWNIIMLLSGVFALAMAMETTGAAAFLARGYIDLTRAWSPPLLVGALYLITVLLTSVMSNNATAALLTPVAIAAALGVDAAPRPLLMAVTFGASTALITPIGYQTNTMIYGPGRYRFTDFVVVGGPLVAILTVVAALLIPIVFPA